MNTRSNSNRVYGLDILKALRSLGVILIHFPFPGKIGSCLVALSRVAVPVFFMITGYFYIDTQNQKCELVQIKKILRLCVFSNILYVLWGLIVEWKGDYTTFFYEIKDRYSFLEIFLFNGSPISGHLWYLNAILYVLVVVYFLSRVFSKHSERILLTLTPFLLLINQIFGNYAPLLLQREYPFVYCRNFLFTGIPYFTLGLFLRKHKEVVIKFTEKRILFVALTLFFAVTTILEWYLLGYFDFFALVPHYISTTFLSVLVFSVFMRHDWDGKLMLLQTIGRKYATDIYIIHLMVNRGVVKMIYRLPIHEYYTLISPIVVFLVSILFSMLFANAYAFLESKYSKWLAAKVGSRQ